MLVIKATAINRKLILIDAKPVIVTQAIQEGDSPEERILSFNAALAEAIRLGCFYVHKDVFVDDVDEELVGFMGSPWLNTHYLYTPGTTVENWFEAIRNVVAF